MVNSKMSLQICKLLKSQQLSVGKKMVSGLALLVPFDCGAVDYEKSQYWGQESTGIGSKPTFPYVTLT
jgi:hypothetical protein